MAKDASEQETPRPRGRPRAEEPLVPVTTWVREREYANLCKLANKTDQPVSTLIRSLLILRLP